ncbi:MAG: hypothetical protein ACXADH_08075 [Candidatus Kariarchaeaceae archaeon]|jgi:hypothetical protein
MNRSAQVFLLLTILVMTFLIGITSVLFDIKKVDYIDPSPDADEFLESWDNTIEAIEQILSIQIAINSQTAVASGTDNSGEIQTEMDSLALYLNSKGLSASIQVDGAIPSLYIIDLQVASHELSLSSSIFVHLSSISGTTIDQVVNMRVSYIATATPNNLVLQKTVNSEIKFLSECNVIVSGGTITDNGNGWYSATASPVDFTITTPDQVLLTITNV